MFGRHRSNAPTPKDYSQTNGAAHVEPGRGIDGCYARPTHAWLGLSPGLDFERRLFHKPEAAAQVRRALAAPGYCPATLVLGANTDPYQPIERRFATTRSILEVLYDCRC